MLFNTTKADLSAIVFSFLCFVSSSLFSQDSAYSKVESSYISFSPTPDSLLSDSIYEALLAKYDKLPENSRERANLCIVIAELREKQGEYSSSIEFYNLSNSIFTEINDKAGQIATLTAKAKLLATRNELDASFTAFLTALEKSRNFGDSVIIAHSNINIAAFLHKQGDYKEALKYSKQAIGLLESVPQDSLLAEAEYLHGYALMRIGALKDAIQHFNSSIKVFKRIKNYNGQGVVLNAIADIMSQEKKWLIAYKNYRRSIELTSVSKNNYPALYRTYINFANLLLTVKTTPEAILIFDNQEFEAEFRFAKTYLRLGILWAKQQHDLEFQMIGFKGMSKFYFYDGDLNGAFRLNASYDSVRELAFNEQRLKIEEIKHQVEGERKDKRISKLEHDNELRSLQAQRNEFFIYLLVILAMFLIAIVGIVIYRSKERRRANRQLMKKNIEIEQQKRTLQEQNLELVLKNKMIEQQKDALQRAMSELTDTQNKLVQSERLASVYQLTAGLVHEINNPVNAISGGVQSLTLLVKDLNEILHIVMDIEEKDAANPIIHKLVEQKELLFLNSMVEDIGQLMDSINNGTERTHAIISSLRIFNRLEEDKFMLSDVNQIIRNLINSLKMESKIPVEFIFRKTELPKTQCYPELITLALKNIAQNAIQIFENEDGRLEFSSKMKQNNLEVEITDNGSGMEESVMKRIFEPFFSTKPIGQGSGLGLAIAHGIIQKHNGEIKVNSTMGKGTTFTISIPLVK